MSVFSLIKRGRAQAKEQSAKKAEKAKEEAVKLPYKHVVTHAALDALSGAPSGWKHTDRPKIMEQNRRRTAMAASEANLAGMPRVGSSMSYVSHASVYSTPVVPLPKNYSYGNIPASWREQLGGPQEGHSYFGQPKSVKGKEPEYIHPLASPVSRSSPAQASAVSSKGRRFTRIRMDSSNRFAGVSLSGSSGNSNSSDDELELGNATTNRGSQNVSHQPSLSRKSSPPSSEAPNRTPLTGFRSNSEAPTKPDRHYPPPAQSTYFSAPRPLNRRALGSDTSVPHIYSTLGRPNSTASFSTSGNFSSASSVESIGLALAPPMPPYAMTRGPDRFTKEPHHATERTRDKTEAVTVPPSPAHPRASTEHRRTSLEIIAATLSGHSIVPPSAPAQRKRRRLSKSRPPKGDDGGVKMSTETARPDRPGTAADSVTTSDFTLVDHAAPQKNAGEVTVTPVPESGRRTTRRLSKNPETKPQEKARWSFRFGSKTSVVTAH
ncbi:dolichyl-phosphate beta-glucosyltransferase [Hypoxylon texense]